MKRINVVFTNISISFISIFFTLLVTEYLLNKLSERETVLNSFSTIKLGLHPPNIKKEVKPSNVFIQQADALDTKQKYYIQTDETGAIVNPEDKNTFYNKERLNILFLGGSTTENMFIKESMRFPAILSKKLNQVDYCGNNSCIVINAGSSGRITSESINVLLNRYLVPIPKKVILMHNINDLLYLLKENKYWQSERHLESIDRYPLLKVNTYTRTLSSIFPNTHGLFVRAYLKYFEGKKDLVNDEERKKDYVKNLPIEVEENLTARFIEVLDIFVNICKIQNIEPILMTQPSRFNDKSIEKLYSKFLPSGITFKEIGRLHNKYNTIIREYTKKGVKVFDLDKEIPPTNENFIDIVHFSESGNKIVAEKIFEKLVFKK